MPLVVVTTLTARLPHVSRQLLWRDQVFTCLRISLECAAMAAAGTSGGWWVVAASGYHMRAATVIGLGVLV